MGLHKMNLKSSLWHVWLVLKWCGFMLLTSIPEGYPILSKQYVNITGDFILGALFPVHKRGSGSDACGELKLQDGIQLLEALLYSVNKINEDEKLLPGIKLGVLALDTCDSHTYAMEQSLDFIKGFISHYNEYHEREFMCDDGNPAKFLGGKFDRIVGVIGGQSSSVSIQVASLLRLFKIPQISYMSTSPQLSNKKRFPYFFRTVPSDETEANAVIDILRYFNWTYVAVVYSDSEYGLHCYEALRDLSANDSICYTTPQRVIRFQFRESDYDQIMQTIINKPNIRVVILVLEKEYMLQIMKAARRKGIIDKYAWIGTDGWNIAESESVEIETILEGAIAIQPLVSHIKGFDEYFTKLTPDHSEVNPWFHEFWEGYFKCKLSVNSSRIDGKDISNESLCDPSLRISPKNGFLQQSFLHFVRDSAYAFAYALHNMHIQLCNGVPGVCDAMSHIDGPELTEYLKNVTFKDEHGNTFRFENEGDGPIRYTIVNFQRNPTTNRSTWEKVGDYSMGPNGTFVLDINSTTLRYRMTEDVYAMEYPASRCPSPCSRYEVKVPEGDDNCCWQCRKCGGIQRKLDEFQCSDCTLGTVPNTLHSECLPLIETYMNYQNPLAIAAMSFSGCGILVTLFVALVFRSYNETPIIKAAGRELSYVLLFGIFLSFCVTFFIVAEPNLFTCSIVRFFLGFCPTLCYAAIVTKTNRIARIFHQKSGPAVPKTKFISPKSQMIIVGILTLVEVIINSVWMVWNPPGTILTFPDAFTKLKICEGLDTHNYMIGFIYPLVLIGFCTIYAIQTRKCPGGFNETKYIAFTNYTIIIIWLAFVPLYLTSTSNDIRVVTLAISLSLSGLVEIGCLFFPKIYIVLFKPEKNTKEVVMAPNRSSFITLCNSASQGISNAPLPSSNGKEKDTESQHLRPGEDSFCDTTSY